MSVGLKRYLSNTGWVLLHRAIMMAMAIFVGAYVARYLGPSQFGIYSYVISFIAIFTPISSLGLQNIVVKELVNRPLERDRLLGTALGLKLLSGILVFLLILLFAILAEDDQTMRFFLVLAGLQPLLRAFDMVTFYHQAKVKSKYSAIAEICAILLISALKIYLIKIEAPLESFIWMLVIDGLFLAVAFVCSYQVLGLSHLNWKFSWREGRGLLQQSWPLIFSAVFAILALRIDQVMLKSMKGDMAVGWYAAAVKISAAWYAVPWLITNSFFPAILNGKMRGISVYRDRVVALFQVLMGLAILAIAPTILLSDWIIEILFEADFAPAADVLKIHVCGAIFVFMGSLAYKWAIAEGLQRLWLWFYLSGAVANIGANLVLIPSYGIEGAAWATLISQSISFFLSYAMFGPSRKLMQLQLQAFGRLLRLKGFGHILTTKNSEPPKT